MIKQNSVRGIFVRFSANLKVIELYSLNILLLVFLALCLWALPQSGDLLVRASEATAVYSRFYLLCALYFYVFITWYTSRAVAWQSPVHSKSYFSAWMMIHLPRLLGYYIYSIFVVAYLNSPLFFDGLINFWIFLGCMLLDLFIYIFLVRIFCWKDQPTERKVAFYNFVFWFNILLIFLCALTGNKWSLLAFVVLSQGMFMFLVVNRAKAMQNTNSVCPPGILSTIFRKLQVDETENALFTVLQVVYIFGLVVYLSAQAWLHFAINAGTLTILFCAFGVISGAVNLLKTLSFLSKINLTLLLFIFLFIMGFFSDPHAIQLQDAANPKATPFQSRQNFDEYLKNWMDHHALELQRDSIVPLIFVHADGGASRSGYWVASVLARLEEEAGFSRNLFCLSGASGGSVGNATFFSLLYSKYQNNSAQQKASILLRSQDFLSTDFLSYTLARMLGPGALINLIAPIIPDRARALEISLEDGMEDPKGMDQLFKTPFSKLVANTADANYPLPILCINVTQMQDGNPALISNIKMDSSISKARLDILSQIESGKDMNLSTATILSARFPYLSPAGLIIEKRPDPAIPGHLLKQHHYYVDGGYFDNSGAGIVQEMIQKIERLKNDTLAGASEGIKFNLKQLKKLRYVIVHITNSKLRNDNLERIHPFKNDFFAPIVTIAGTYGSQTAVNNTRLEDYFYSLNKYEKLNRDSVLNKYFDINLYTRDPKDDYPMNWVISNAVRKKMNERLGQQDELNTLIRALKSYYLKHPTSEP
jgi:predicted acylesterase/phospholipase RssA